VERGSTIQTDGWQAYESLVHHGYAHDRRPHTPGWAKRGERATPYADQAISASKRWIIGTYNKPPRDHLPTYLAEYAFRREFADPATAFETLLRVLMTAPPITQDAMIYAGDLPRIPATVSPPRKPAARSSWSKAKPARNRRKPGV
jgi:transposase-like protein